MSIAYMREPNLLIKILGHKPITQKIKGGSKWYMHMHG